MSETNPEINAEAPALRLQKMYVKDLSFENPNAPSIYLEKAGHQAEVNLGIKNRKIDDDHWEVAIHLTATVKAGEKVAFIVEVEHAGLYLLRKIPQEHMAGVLAVDCPTLLFPFTRQIISQAVVDGGFVPFLLEPVNFLAMYQNAQKKPDPETTH